MNKITSIKHANLTKKSQKMRIIYKNRNNMRQMIHPQRIKAYTSQHEQKDESQRTVYGQLIGGEQQGNRDEMRKKMKTEYQNNYNDRSFDSHNKSFKQENSKHNVQNKANTQTKVVKPFQKSLDLTQFQTNLPRKKSSKQPHIQTQPSQKYTFHQIQSKIQQLMQKRLSQLSQYKYKQDWKLDYQLNKIISYIRSLRQSQEYKNNDMKQNDINFLQKKIQMIEKLIAENMTQSEIMKKYFLSKVSNNSRNRHVSYHKYKNEKLELSHEDGTNARQKITSTTNHQQVYKTPSKSSYNKFKYAGTFFNAEKLKQPLPRSSYKRDYLINPCQVSLPVKPEDHYFMRTYQSAKLVNSSYNSEYQNKKTELVNHRDLDAFRDKFKNLPIIFGRKQKQVQQQLGHDLKTIGHNRQHQQLRKSRVINQGVLKKPIQFIKTLLSQTKRQYRDDNIKKYCRSTIKHRSIERLRCQFKKKYNV